ncbi:serine/threonine-protein kinase [Kibdelosporangium aridum]|uniref:non-specific serine/threonine protein kinase n=1 Tax=Kibdelosporangium aridum TaxID=2030 RepID=A0A1W2FW10_KIBAR|nr:serine/threonine-protein kinase [Kibdelosporangium aridum]SMD25798.1 serine/threonine-protein kinase PknG [Kibdelosporangium aridum]
MTLTCCGKPVSVTGFCDVCGCRRVAPPGSTQSTPGESKRSDPSSYSGTFAADELYSLPPVEVDDPEAGLQADPVYKEERQFCANPACNAQVGRRIEHQPPMRRGVCPFCETPFSFVLKLKRGEVVANRYEVRGFLAAGGMGWIYLAKDRELRDTYVVLKGMINPTHAQRLNLAVVERDALTQLNHPNIVRIIGYAEHPDPDTGEADHYIVMEYVAGKTLQELLHGGFELRLEHVTAYGHGILSALAYMHDEKKLLYCDMKPDNVMHAGTSVKIIDLGGTRAIGDRDSARVVTEKFVDSEELATKGLTVRSDVRTVGMTLAMLLERAKSREPEPDRMAVGLESLELLIARATEKYDKRFVSAKEMLEQLDGVHRELLSLRDGHARAVPSARFEDMVELLDAGLGAVPSSDRWTAKLARKNEDGVPADAIDDGLPEPASAASRLPLPWIDENDPAADLLSNTRVLAEPRKRLREYVEEGGHLTHSVELNLAAARVHLELAAASAQPEPGELADAEQRIMLAQENLGGRVAYDWRIAWHEGLLRLAKGEVALAEDRFRKCYGSLPGEEIPKLAIGFCLEQRGYAADASKYYDAVRCRDPRQASAVFGLARLAQRQGDREGAVSILDGLPRVSRHYYAAKIAAVRILLAHLANRKPQAKDINNAADRVPKLFLDGGEPDGEARQRMVALLREAALRRVWRSRPDAPQLDGAVAEDVSEDGLRKLLERSYQELAKHARDRKAHDTLIDRANSIRPWSWW